MVGASLALGLSGSGIRTLLAEAVPVAAPEQSSFDERTTALGNASRRIFQGLKVWERMAPQAAAIRTIHVSDAGHFGFARLRAAEQGVDAFGYVIRNRVIGTALWEALQTSKDILLRVPARPDGLRIESHGVTFSLTSGASRPETVRASLVVAADGAQSLVRAAADIEARVKDYKQVAVIANVTADRPHDGTAYERFTPSGPLAVLPLYDGGYGVIWTCTPDRAAEVLDLDDRQFLSELQARFGWRAGHFVRASRRALYPLKLSRAASTIATRTVLIGNAAQALHPVAGQGFNLGLRDAAMLAEMLVTARGERPDADLGSADLLQKFAGWRADDRRGVIRFTDGLVRLFGDSRPGVGILRNAGLLLFDLAPPAKSALARVSAGFGGRTPRLARGRSLQP